MMIQIRRKVFAITIIAAIFIIGLILGLYFAFKKPSNYDQSKVVFEHGRPGAVVANGIECAGIGRDILAKGGSGIDSAIATLFCEGVTCPQSMGIGGGFLATIYTKSSRKVEVLIARESAPLKATKDMFVNKNITGGLAIAVPGEVKGYWELHQKYGVLPWNVLVQPTIDLCRNGIIVTSYLARMLKRGEDIIKNIDSLSEIFINPKTNKVWNVNDVITRPVLANTLEIIAQEGADAIYGKGGKIGKMLAEDIQKFNGIITEKDFEEYKVQWKKPSKAKINGHTLYTTPVPGSGDVLSLILNVLNNHLKNIDPITFWHRIVESFKHGYGLRTHLGDIEHDSGIQEIVNNLTNPEYANYIRTLIKDDRTFTNYDYYGANFSNLEDHGTANIAVLAPNGDAVSLTSTVNNIFGSLRRSQSTGIILNDEMDDFSTPGKVNGFGIPPSPANFIEPRKRPLSSMCPSIILDKNDNVRLIIGAAGGSKITTALALVIVRHLLLNETLDHALQAKRLHHQLAPMEIQHEVGFDQNILDGLKNLNHTLHAIPPQSGFAAMTAISVFNDYVDPVFDNRRNGSKAILTI